MASIGCAAAYFELRRPLEWPRLSPERLALRLEHAAAPPRLRPSNQTVSSHAPPASGTTPPRAHPPHPRAPESPSWRAAHAPSFAFAACPHGRGLQRTPSLRAARSYELPGHAEQPPATLRRALPPAATPCARSAPRKHFPPPWHPAQTLRSAGSAAHAHLEAWRPHTPWAVLRRPSMHHNAACGSTARHFQQCRSPSVPSRQGPHRVRAFERSFRSFGLLEFRRSSHQVYGLPRIPASALYCTWE